MIRIFAAAAVALCATSAMAQFQQGNTRTTVNPQLVRLLEEGYDIKAAFAEAGVPYVILQKATSAYLCRGAGATVCEKLN